MRIYLDGVNRFNDIFTSFYARQRYDVTNDVTRASLTAEDRLLIKALRIEKGWRCGSNDCGISCQTVETTHVFLTHERTYEQRFLVTMSTSTNKHRHNNKLLGLLLPPPWTKKTLHEISNFIVKILLYVIRIVSLMTDA